MKTQKNAKFSSLKSLFYYPSYTWLDCSSINALATLVTNYQRTLIFWQVIDKTIDRITCIISAEIFAFPDGYITITSMLISITFLMK